MKLGRRDALKLFGISSLSYGLVGCQSIDVGDSIKMGVTGRPRTLDPGRATDALSSRLNRLIYQALIDFNEASQPQPALADWQMLTPTHYQFTLREPFALFHHGQPLTAQDVVASYKRVLDADFGSPHRGNLRNIASVELDSERQVSFRLHQSDPLFVNRLTLGILPADLIAKGHNFGQSPIGSGPMRFISSNEQGVVLQRQDGVEIQFIVVTDALVRVLKLVRGELDLIQNDLSPELVAYCQQHSALNVAWQIGSNFAYVGMNMSDPLLSNPLLRQAIAMGIDRQAIIDAMFKGQARLAGALLPAEHWAGHDALTGVSYNPDQAAAFISELRQQQAVPSSGLLPLSFKTSSDPTRIRIATLYQAQLRSVGIDLQIQSYDWGTFYSDIVQGRFQLFSLAWVGIKSPDIFDYVFASHALPPNGANRGRYQSARADELIIKAGQSSDLALQAHYYRELQAHLADDLPVIPLWYENQYVVTARNLQGYQLYSDGRYDSLVQVTKNL
ncbi:peptide/nickel transport system substrate-binding protein [Thiomicrospira sp. ALE5]|nr:peptide/nickel transport system substrate-binding protein [Thiomicrospira sp. ALE5]